MYRMVKIKNKIKAKLITAAGVIGFFAAVRPDTVPKMWFISAFSIVCYELYSYLLYDQFMDDYKEKVKAEKRAERYAQQQEVA